MSSATSALQNSLATAAATSDLAVMSRASNARATSLCHDPTSYPTATGTLKSPLPSSEEFAVPVASPNQKRDGDISLPQRVENKVASKESSADMASCVHLSSSVDSSYISLAASILSKASALSTTKKNDANNETTNNSNIENNPMSEEPSSSSSSSSSSSAKNEINDDEEDSSVPAYVTAPQPADTIFAVRKKELHFLSDIFFQDCQGWMQDDYSVLSSDDDQSDMDEDEDDCQMETSTHDGIYVEYAGKTNFDPSNERYRKSLEMSALLFAEALVGLIDDESDSDDDE